MIKNYDYFILESKFQEIEEEYHSIGEYIESVSSNDNYILRIVSNYINDSDTDIRISNAVNLLNDFDKKKLFDRVYNYIENGEEDKDISVMANVVLESAEVSAGKFIFISFLKSLTALGLKNVSKSDNPDGYLFFYKTSDVEINNLKSIFYRFKSLTMFVDKLDHTNGNCSLYYGIKSNGSFDYGFYTDKIITIGNFSITKSNFNWLLLLKSPSALSLKRDLLSLDVKKILLFGKISSEMKFFTIKEEKKSALTINNDIISFGYHGIGKWNNNILDEEEYKIIKSKFKSWLSKYKWSQNVLVNVTYSSYWIYFNIKIK